MPTRTRASHGLLPKCRTIWKFTPPIIPTPACLPSAAAGKPEQAQVIEMLQQASLSWCLRTCAGAAGLESRELHVAQVKGRLSPSPTLSEVNRFARYRACLLAC